MKSLKMILSFGTARGLGEERCLPFDVILSFAACIMGIVAVVYYRSLDYDLAGALYGWSPTSLIRDFWFTPSFQSVDYPGGETEAFKSLALQGFPLLSSLGIGAKAVLAIMTAIEALSLAIGGAVATILLNRHANLSSALITGLLLLGSTIASPNLVRWGHPYYGSAYNYAYGFGLAGVALLLTRAPKLGAALLGISIAIHPILGVLFCIFAMFGILSDPQHFSVRSLPRAAALFLLFSLPWLAWSMRDASLSGAAIPADAYVAITRMMSYHWFPISGGVFGRIAYERFVPFLSFLLLCTIYLFHDYRSITSLERRVAAGMLGGLAVTFLGVLASEYSNTPLFVKLALGRESSVLLLVGTLFVVPGLVSDVMKASLSRAVPVAALLVAAFRFPYGVPAAPALWLGIVVVFDDVVRGNRSVRTVSVAGMVLIVLGVLVWLMMAGHLLGLQDSRYTGLSYILNVTSLALAALLIVGRFIGSGLAIPVALAAATVLWAPALSPIQDDLTRDRAKAYLEVELWAKGHTQPGTLFAPDPAHAYGWREYSERPSFGSVREWLYAGWAYNSRADIFREGLARFAFIGMNLDEATERERMEPDYGKSALLIDVQNKYYNLPARWFWEASRRYHIQYFVLDKSLAGNIEGLTTVYENQFYSVRKVEFGVRKEIRNEPTDLDLP